MNILEIKNPNTLGELLREKFFKGQDYSFGYEFTDNVLHCGYKRTKLVMEDSSGNELDPSDFQIREEFDTKFLEWTEFLDADCDEQWTVGVLNLEEGKFEVQWYSDGDVTVVFKLPDGKTLFNDDAKKPHNWKWNYNPIFD